MTKTVAIVGCGPGARYPKTGEVWSVNFQPPRGAHYTRCFQLHPWKGRNRKEDAWLDRCDVPVYTLRKERNPQTVVYPIQAISRLGGPLCSSFDYMMALAILEQFAVIDLYGIALQCGTMRERLMEHVSLAYWIGRARGLGIRVRIHGEMILHFPYRYGYDYDAERTYGQRMAFWAATSMLNFRFDDGEAKGPPVGWKAEFSSKKVKLSI